MKYFLISCNNVYIVTNAVIFLSDEYVFLIFFRIIHGMHQLHRREACSEERGTHHFLSLIMSDITMFAALYQLWRSWTG